MTDDIKQLDTLKAQIELLELLIKLADTEGLKEMEKTLGKERMDEMEASRVKCKNMADKITALLRESNLETIKIYATLKPLIQIIEMENPEIPKRYNETMAKGVELQVKFNKLLRESQNAKMFKM